MDQQETEAQQHQLQLEEASRSVKNFYGDVRSFLESEMAMQEEEWAYLMRAHTLMLHRYRSLNVRAEEVLQTCEQAKVHLSKLPEYFSKVDHLERNIETLESVVAGLDQYSRILEEKYAPEE